MFLRLCLTFVLSNFMGFLVPSFAVQTECESLEDFLKICDRFSKEQRKDRLVTHERWWQGKLANKVIVKSKGEWFIVRDSRNNMDSDVDDLIAVRGPSYTFLVAYANSIDGDDGRRKYNLLAIGSSQEEQDPESPLGLCQWYAEVLPDKPVTFWGQRVSTFLNRYNKTKFEKIASDQVQISFSDAKDINNHYRSGSLTFLLTDFGPALQKSFSKAEIRDESGKVTSSSEGETKYNNVPGQQYGFGEFEGERFVGGWGERTRFEAIEIHDEEFTPEFYGIDPGVGLARAGINWWLWGTIIGCISMIIVGMWLKRRSS